VVEPPWAEVQQGMACVSYKLMEFFQGLMVLPRGTSETWGPGGPSSDSLSREQTWPPHGASHWGRRETLNEYVIIMDRMMTSGLSLWGQVVLWEV
jgi:hypothetical protein